jgi:hypothetical protein
MKARSHKLTTLALAGITLLSPLAADQASAGLFDKLKSKVKDKFREVTTPQYLLGKLQERMAKKNPGGVAPAPAPVFGTPAITARPTAPAPRVAAPVTRSAPAPVPGTFTAPVRAKPRPAAKNDAVQACLARLPAAYSASAVRRCHELAGSPGTGTNPVVEGGPGGEASQRELGLRLLRQAEQLLGRAHALAALRGAQASDKVIRRSLARFRDETRLDAAGLKSRSIARMHRLGGESEMREELAGGAEGARGKGPTAVTAAEKTYAKLERAAREAALKAAVLTFRKARKVAMKKARKLIAEYRNKMSLRARKEMVQAYKQAIAEGTSRAEAEKIARSALAAARKANAEAMETFRQAETERALDEARTEAWEAAEQAYAKEEEAAHRAAVDIDELMNASQGEGDEEASKGAAQQARVALGEASQKLQVAAKEVAGIFGVGFQGSPSD